MTARADLRAAVGNVALVLGSLGILAIVFVALFGDRLAPYDPQAWRIVEFYDNNILVPPSPPDSHHILGTDPLGRDQLSRLLWGARLSLEVTLLAVLIRLGLALAVGALAAAARGIGDAALTTLTNVASGYPQLMLALLVGVALRNLGMIGFVVALGVVGWPELAGFLRVELRRIARSPYVEAAWAMGASPRRIAFGHIGRNALPQIIGVTALETAAVLLLLAELGFIGLFVAGSVSFIDDAGAAVLPVRDRAPEWGQMLAGAQGYVTNRQWVAYVPGLVVVSAVFAFNLFGEGIRAALDPHGRSVLSPRALAWAARGFAGLVVLGAGSFAVASVASARGLSYEDGLALARAAADRERPGSTLVASVVRFSSQAHGLDRPEKLNYYFVDSEGTSLRVGYLNADPLAAEVRRFEDDDNLTHIFDFPPVDPPEIPWQEALVAAEASGGNAYRSSNRGWIARVVLRQSPIGPVYHVRYSPIFGPAQVDRALDARTGSTDLPLAVRLGDAYDGMLRQLGKDAVLVRARVSWRTASRGGRLTAARTTDESYQFARADATGAIVWIDLAASGTTQTFTLAPPTPRPAALETIPPMQSLFQLVEDNGGRGVHLEWDRGQTPWFAFGTLEMVDGAERFTLRYSPQAPQVGSAQFSVDIARGEVRRVN